MGAGGGVRRPVKIRRRGRHTTPSQVEKVAEKAGRAAPAVAIAGALVATPQLQHALAAPSHVAVAEARQPAAAHRPAAATLDSLTVRSNIAGGVAKTRHTAAKKAARNTYYKVRAGDTLSGIAERFYHNAGDWEWIYHENEKTVSNPNLIYPGETLLIPAHAPAHDQGSYTPRHAKTAPRVTRSSHHGGGTTTDAVTTQLSGTLGCSGLEELWEEADGNHADAFIAAEIAMAESGGQQYALSPTDDYGYWQINATYWGSLATFDPLGNARAAVQISADGTNWSPWTTYNTGAYAGRC